MPSNTDALAEVATLSVTPWPDPVVDSVGHEIKSDYVERFWLGILGPSTTLLLRRLVDDLEAHARAPRLRGRPQYARPARPRLASRAEC